MPAQSAFPIECPDIVAARLQSAGVAMFVSGLQSPAGRTDVNRLVTFAVRVPFTYQVCVTAFRSTSFVWLRRSYKGSSQYNCKHTDPKHSYLSHDSLLQR